MAAVTWGSVLQQLHLCWHQLFGCPVLLLIFYWHVVVHLGKSGPRFDTCWCRPDLTSLVKIIDLQCHAWAFFKTMIDSRGQFCCLPHYPFYIFGQSWCVDDICILHGPISKINPCIGLFQEWPYQCCKQSFRAFTVKIFIRSMLIV